MVYLSPELRDLCIEANLTELSVIRDQYRHILPTSDLRFLDKLIAAKQAGATDSSQVNS